MELLPQLQMSVARVGHLIAMKVLSRDDVTRPQDVGDLRAAGAAAGGCEQVFGELD